MSLLVYCCSNHMTHLMSFFFNDTATTDIYTLSLHDALPISSGGIRPGFGAGTLMLLSDHLNLMFRNPLIGPLIEGEERFPDMTEAYDAGLRTLAKETAARLKVTLEEGVYAALLGPSYETPAEVRMLGDRKSVV